MNKPWKLIVLLIGIFLAGGATGALLGTRMARVMPPNRPPPSAELWASQHLKRITEKVGLQPGQMEQIKPVVDQGMTELFDMRSRFLSDNRARREQMERDVLVKMLPEQRVKYEQMNWEFQERSRKLEKGAPNARPAPGGK